MNRLGGHAEMPHDGNADAGHRGYPIDHNRAAFQLDCLSPSLQKPSRITQRIFAAGLIGHEGHIPYDERSLGGPRYEQRPDPNHQNPYRPMYSLDATPPGQPHPYFQTRKDGFGYPASRPVEVYLGNGIYVIPR